MQTNAAGATLAVPDAYIGEVQTSAGTIETERAWKTSSQFQRFTYWNHDLLPSQSDLPPRALTWLDIAQQVRVARLAMTAQNQRKAL